MSGSPIGATYFSFKADRVGVALITFTSRVNQLQFLGMPVLGYDVRTIKTLDVQDCKYRVSVSSFWQVPGPANINIYAKIEIAGMVDAGGGSYTGEAAVQWETFVAQVEDCQGTIPPESQAHVVGQVLDDDMTLTVTYDAAPVAIAVNCGISGVQNVTLTPATLSLVPIATEGGSARRAQILGGPGNDPGDAIIILQPAASQ